MSTTSVLFLPFGLLFTGNLGPGPAAAPHSSKIQKNSVIWGSHTDFLQRKEMFFSNSMEK